MTAAQHDLQIVPDGWQIRQCQQDCTHGEQQQGQCIAQHGGALIPPEQVRKPQTESDQQPEQQRWQTHAVPQADTAPGNHQRQQLEETVAATEVCSHIVGEPLYNGAVPLVCKSSNGRIEQRLSIAFRQAHAVARPDADCHIRIAGQFQI